MRRSQSILGKMARRAATSRLVLTGVIIVLLGAIVLVIYLRWLR